MYCECGKIIENKDTVLCATCGAKMRKHERMLKRTANTRKKALARVSKSQKERLTKYIERSREWIKGKRCAVCNGKATECHHMQGREGSLLMDETKWLPVCRKCHTRITIDSKWAIENGFSILRSK